MIGIRSSVVVGKVTERTIIGHLSGMFLGIMTAIAIHNCMSPNKRELGGVVIELGPCPAKGIMTGRTILGKADVGMDRIGSGVVIGLMAGNTV